MLMNLQRTVKLAVIGAPSRKPIATVWLERRVGSPHPFFCPDCRNMLMSYTGEIVSIVPGGIQIHTPTSIIQCQNRNCGKKFQFVYVAELEV